MAATSTSQLPLRDQVALRLLGCILMGGGTIPDPGTAVAAAYAYGDAFLETARANYRAAKAAEDKTHAHAPATD